METTCDMVIWIVSRNRRTLMEKLVKLEYSLEFNGNKQTNKHESHLEDIILT